MQGCRDAECRNSEWQNLKSHFIPSWLAFATRALMSSSYPGPQAACLPVGRGGSRRHNVFAVEQSLFLPQSRGDAEKKEIVFESSAFLHSCIPTFITCHVLLSVEMKILSNQQPFLNERYLC